MNCESCRFWYWLRDDEGECRHGPPTSHAIPKVEHAGGTRFVAVWPKASAEEWCGAYEKDGSWTEDEWDRSFAKAKEMYPDATGAELNKKAMRLWGQRRQKAR